MVQPAGDIDNNETIFFTRPEVPTTPHLLRTIRATPHIQHAEVPNVFE
jgi:hypothetical protein